MSVTVSSKYSKKGFHHAKQSATDTLKATSKRLIQKIADAILFDCNKITDAIAKSYDDKTTTTASRSNPETAPQTDETSIKNSKRKIYIQKRESILLTT